MNSRIQFLASLHKLPVAIEWLRAHLEKAGFSRGDILRLELVLEEAFVNSVQHGYQGKEGLLELEFKAHLPSHIEFSITDFGPPFNPLKEAPEVELEKPIEERKEGGLGIYLMKKCVDDAHYARIGDANVLRFMKKV